MRAILILIAIVCMNTRLVEFGYGGEEAKSLPQSNTKPGKVFVYKQSGGKPREMEIYFPPRHEPSVSRAPGLILFHGGAWGGGDLNQFRRACEYFASRGMVAATVNYRMLTGEQTKALPKGETRKRVCITDAKSAIRWFKQHADELGLDPNRVVTGGGSAGGHICVLATTNPGLNDPADPVDIDTSVVGYLLFNPAFALNDNQDLEVDVLQYLKPTFPPAIVFFGTVDSWRQGWDAAQEKLKLLGNERIQLKIANEQKHGFFNQDPWQTVTLIEADRFLKGLGFLQGEPTLPPPSTGESLTR